METQTNHDYTRRNRFTGESIELTKEEADKHDKIFYHEHSLLLRIKNLAQVLANTGTKCVNYYHGL